MTESNGYIRTERRRMVQVRRALAQAIQGNKENQRDLTDFYNACADYILYAQGRVHRQDFGIVDTLKERVPAEQTEHHALIDELKGRLQRSSELTDDFSLAAKSLREEGVAQQQTFEQAAERFFTEVVKALGTQRNPMSHITDQVIEPDDWVKITGVTDEIRAQEEGLFRRIQEVAPHGFDPADMSTGHPQSWSD